jgi:hypothetical protein
MNHFSYARHDNGFLARSHVSRLRKLECTSIIIIIIIICGVGLSP